LYNFEANLSVGNYLSICNNLSLKVAKFEGPEEEFETADSPIKRLATLQASETDNGVSKMAFTQMLITREH
jgi:hypothetical protein